MLHSLKTSTAMMFRPSLLLRLGLVVVVATAAAFAIHVLYGRGWANSYVGRAASEGRLNGGLHEPYPTYVVVIAFATALIPMTCKVILYLLVRDRLPGKSRVAKGLVYGLLLLAISDALVRLPLMNFIVGNPPDVVFVQGLEEWVINPVIGLVLALLAP